MQAKHPRKGSTKNMTTTVPGRSPPFTLIYDGECAFCTRWTRWVQRHDRDSRIHCVPHQTPGVMKRYGLTREKMVREVWWISSSGDRFGGAYAVNEVLKHLGGIWSWLGKVLEFPPLLWLEQKVYEWVAKHRHYILRCCVATRDRSIR